MILILLLLYFIPTYIAAGRKHKSVGAIFAVNLFFGWTILGFWWAFIWALTSADNQTIVVNVVHPSNAVPPPLPPQ